MREGIVVIGDGPAGAAAAAACAEVGLAVTVVAPRPGVAWRRTYGAWLDELALPDAADVLAHRWERPLVLFDAGAPVALERAYVLLDNAALALTLRQRAAAAGARSEAGAASRVTHDDDGAVVHLADGRDLPAGVVIDATGHRPALARAGAGAEPAWQTAYGIVARLDPSPLPPGGMWLMDWRAGPLRGVADATTAPTFCYAMDLGNGQVLVEETALASRPAMCLDDLHGRLLRRIEGCGGRVVETLGLERVRFPLGGPLPPRHQRIVAFGAAAGMVHPATGYQVAAALRRAPDLAGALARVLGRSDATPAEAAVAAWDAVWPEDLVRQRTLHALGLEVLLGLDSAAVQGFFRVFFDLPTTRWSAYTSGASSSRRLAGIMLSVARRLPPRLGWHVVRSAMGGDAIPALRAALARPVSEAA